MSTQDGATVTARHNVFTRLYRGETSFDFVGRRRRWFLLSGAVILVGVASLFIRGLNFSIDFDGGTAWQVTNATLSISEVHSALQPLGLASATVETLGTGSSRTVEVEYRLSGTAAHQQTLQTEVTDKLAAAAGVSSSEVSLTSVGPTWGSDITRHAVEALIVFFLAIGAYIAIRFEWKMALSAIVAVVHDLLVTVGIYSLSGYQVTPDTVVAVLTILGYSLYDTIVVFDRVQENARGLAAQGRTTYSGAVNLSMNQVLMRSMNTSIVAILPILSVLVIGAQLLGATTLQDFGLALFIGLTTGAYSSLFIASPLLAMLKEHEPRYVTIRSRLEARGEALTLLTPAAAAAGNFGAAPAQPSGSRTARSQRRVVSPVQRETVDEEGDEDEARELATQAAGDRARSSPDGPATARPATARPATSRRAAPPRGRKKGGGRRR